ncbi:acyl carrier protein [Microbacterium aurantiacum]|uniref:Acyl carrier protein n=1 Tax=Microbacterium aurantiacum TaxID=162393 RepID=A0AAJ2HGB5_9MICO|nr:acyl carrier protein [Microbacterium aurantiacum]MDS0244214.1 acyl carrier protein [Microbacterium aurantiacum]
MSTPETIAASAPSPSDLGDWLVDRVRFYDQVDAESVTLDAPLKELGLDSIYVMTLCGDIEDTYGVEIDPAFFADHSDLRGVAEALHTRVTAT